MSYLLLHAPTPEVPGWLLIPFALLLLCIAVLPLVAGHWWESNLNRLIITLSIGVPTAIVLVRMGFGPNLYHQIVYDYLPVYFLVSVVFLM